MSLQAYINTDIEFLKKVLSLRYGKHYNQCSLTEIQTLVEQFKDDISTYVLYPINPLYDYFMDIGITDETEMRKILATLFYFSMKQELKSGK